MLRSRIIPCLLMRNKGLVKTKRFEDEKYVGDPINAVKIFNEKEVDELTIYDIGASVIGKQLDYDYLASIAASSRMPLCYGGGVLNSAMARDIVSLGFEKISVSSTAVSRPELVNEMADAIGQQSVVVTIDARRPRLFGDYAIYTHNGRKKHSATLQQAIANFSERGAGEIVVNSINRDGTMQGYDLDLARIARASTDLPLTIVGGAGSPEHMRDLISQIGVVGAAAGSYFVFKGRHKAVLLSYTRP